MSVFSADDPIPENPLNELVGEGKKYASVEDLAKAYFHADRTLSQRNRELSELRTDLHARETVEALLTKVSTPAAQSPTPPVAHQPAEPARETPDVAALVQQEIEKINQTQTVQTNVRIVTDGLIKAFGSEDAANNAVKAKAAELGVSVEFLQDVATKSPKAFFAQMGVNPDSPPPAPARPTSGDVNPAALASTSTNAKPGTYAFYEQLRKTNPRVYYDPKIQNQMHREAQEKGEAFFK